MEEIEYPLYFPCNSTTWNSLEKQANAILGLPNDEKETYSRPFKDASGNIYFYVTEEVVSLVDVSECLTHDKINWPTLS